jgi:SOS-response transcriptional repressor LexA
MVKGAQSSGKTVTAAYRALYLKSSYCLYEDEKVLVVSSERDNIDVLKKLYNNANDENTYDYVTLFTMLRDEPISFFTVEDLVNKYSSHYMRENKLEVTTVSDEDKLQIVKACIQDLKPQYSRVKFIKDSNEAFIIDEINWIKACDFNTAEEYMSADRLGRRGVRLIKNSTSREAMYNIMLLYNQTLRSNKLIDSVDKELFALREIENNSFERYTHMVIDDAHKLTKLQIKLLMALNSKKAYSSMMLMVDHKAEACSGGWIVKGRKQKELGLEVNIKNCYLKKAILPIEEPIEEENKELQNRSKYSMEKYLYVDVRHRKSFEFVRDTSNYDELILVQEDNNLLCSKDELASLPVYSNIAAGEPISINPEVEDTFNIPHYWIKGMKDCFMLKVKGDSMTGAGIEDGDFVVIRKQTMASNRDIVAVNIEGSATLKRLCMDKNDVLLMPENEKYSPISIKNREAIVLGVVVGIIKYAA